MASPIYENVSSLTQIGRVPIIKPRDGQVFYNYTADFTANSTKTIVFNFNAINQPGIFGVPKSVFVDNGNNPSPVIVSATITNQTFTVPAYAQGNFTLEATESSEISFTSDGGATDKGKITLYNYSVAPSVWYSYGTFNNNKAIKVQGTMQEGDTVNIDPDNRPVFIGGIDRATGLFHAVYVDAQGRVEIAGNVTIGAVFGPDAIGVPPTKAPVFTAVLDSAGNIKPIQLDANNNVPVAQTKPSTGAITSVAANVASTLILAANANRKGAVLYNNSTSTVNVSFANVNAATTPSIILPANGSVTLQANDYTGRINAAWAVAAGSMLVTEFS